MKHVWIGIWLGVLAWSFAAGAQAAKPIFGETFVGDGVRYRQANWDDELFPVNVNNAWGYINQQGQLVVLPQYDWADDFHQGVGRVMIEGVTGYVNTDGRWVIEPQFKWADRFEEGSAIVSDGRRFGVINRSGRLVVPITLDGILRFREGLAAVQSGGRIGYINRKAEQVIAYQFSRARSFHEGLAVVQLPDTRGLAGKLGYIDRQGTFVFDAADLGLDDLGDFNTGLAPAMKEGKWGFINRQFEWVIEPTYDAVRGFFGGLAAVRLDGRWGYIDDEGEIIIEPQFDEAYDFDEVLALVKRDGRYGYCDREGQLSVAPQFKNAQPYFRNFARVAQAPSFGYIDINGKIIWDPRGVFDGLFDLTRIGPNGDVPRIPIAPHRRAAKVPYPSSHRYVEELPKPSPRR